MGLRESDCALQDYLLFLYGCHEEPNLGQSFISLVLRAPVGEVVSLSKIQIYLLMCAIFTVLGWRKLENTGRIRLSFRFPSIRDTDEGPSEGLSN